jgi:hypothetical protein
MNMDKDKLLSLLKELGKVYEALDGQSLEVGVCGGAGLILMGLIDRTTKDIDAIFPTVWPEKFSEAVQIIAKNYGLSANWINLGAEQLTMMGLPDGFMERAEKVEFGNCLTFYFASRYDQIFFKVYASADRGGYHVDDLLALHPTEEELLEAAKWCFTHDISPEFKKILVSMFEQLGYATVAKKI